MQYLVPILLILCIAVLVVRLRNREAQLRELQLQAAQSVHEAKAICDAVWNHANTIHLYAALTEEESTSASIQEKQAAIRSLSEKILQITQT